MSAAGQHVNIPALQAGGTAKGPDGSQPEHWSTAAVEGLKTVAGAVFGASVGLLAVSATGSSSKLVAVLAGVTLGVLALGPGRPKKLEDWLGRGALALALGITGGVLMAGASHLVAAWAACSLGLALAANDTSQRNSAAELLFRGSMAAAATGLAFYVMLVGSDGLGASSVMALAGIMGVGGFLAGWMEVDAAPAERPALPSRRSGKGGKASQTVDAEFPNASGGDVSVFSAESEQLQAVAQRVEELLGRTEVENPEERVFVESVRERVQTTMTQAQESVQRWRKAGSEFEAQRIVEVAAQLESNRSMLLEISDTAMRRELSLAIERQERMLSMLSSMERARVTFGLRLAQVASGLELLEVTLKRALTVGEGIDTSEIDALVEVMDAFADNYDEDDADASETDLVRLAPAKSESPATETPEVDPDATANSGDGTDACV